MSSAQDTIEENRITAPRHPRAVSLLVLGFFFFSGAFALVYEVSWVRAMTLEFGSTTLAVSTVLTVFMGGLSLGSWIVGRWADRWTDPLTKYGLIEILVAEYALLTPLLFLWIFPLFGLSGAKIGGDFYLISLLRFLVSTLLLIVPTMLMGATLPVLSRFHLLWEQEGAGGPGLLYGINTLGAFAGTLTAGLYFIPQWGLLRTILGIGACNLLLGIVAFVAGKILERGRSEISSATAPVYEAQAPPPPSSLLTVMVAVGLTGFAGMACEVAWTRALTLVLGASTYAFTIMLATFLAGLGLGAAVVASVLKTAPSKSRVVFFSLAITASILVCVSSASFQYLPDLFRKLYWLWDLKETPGYLLDIQFLAAGIVMLIPALVMGGLFPAAVRVVVHDPSRTGRSIATLYAWNTLGAILGSFVAGFLLIPALGIRGTLLTAVSAQTAGGVLAVLCGTDRKKEKELACAGGCTLLLALFFTPPWHRQLMSSAMYHYAGSYEIVGPQGLKRKLETEDELLYYRDGLTATVTVGRSRREKPDDIYIATNGKMDGSSYYDMPTQRLSAHIPLLFHSNPENVCVIGMGTGCTVGSAALHPVKRVTVVEIESAMVEGAKFFRKVNHDVHTNPKVAIEVTDGRLFLRLHPDAFDVVISEPSNPWIAGSADLFTVEFFRLGAQALRSEGIFCQWVHLYGMSTKNLRVILRTFSQVFPEIYLISTIPNTDILLLGSESPLALELGRLEERFRNPLVEADLSDQRVGIGTVFDLLARFRIGPSEIRKLTGSGPLHTDDLPLIAYQAPFDLYRKTREENMKFLALHSSGIAYDLQGLPDSPSERREFFQKLALSYRRFLSGGREAVVCDQLAGE